MKAELRHSIEELEASLRKLVELNAALRNENQQLSEELGRLRTQFEGQKLAADEEKKTNNLINIAKHFGDEEMESAEIKERINHYLKYIDQCIELLNK
jgi:regulator of replication initiation timing